MNQWAIYKIFKISCYTLRDLLRSKVLGLTILLAFCISAMTYVATSLTYATTQRVALDIGVSLSYLSTIFLSFLLGITLLSSEIENRTLYIFLASPLKRSHFLLGKIGGVIFLLLINVSILLSLTLCYYFFTGGEFNSLILWCLVLNFLEAILMLLFVVLFSLLVQPMIALTFSLAIFIAGHSVTSTLLTHFSKENKIIYFILKSYLFIFPNLERLNFKDYLLYQQSVSLETLLFSLFHVMIYSAILLLFLTYIFSRKDLD